MRNAVTGFWFRLEEACKLLSDVRREVVRRAGCFRHLEPEAGHPELGVFGAEHGSDDFAPPARPRAQPRRDERLACAYRSESNERKRSVDEHGNLAEEGGVPSHTQSAAVRIPEVCRSLAGSATSHPSSAFDMRLNYARSEQIPTKNHRSDSHRVSVTT